MANLYHTPTARFLTTQALALDAQACNLFARAEVLAHYGFAEAAVHTNARAIDCEDRAECLRLQSRRVADMNRDEREMRAEGYSAGDVRIYLARTYGK